MAASLKLSDNEPRADRTMPYRILVVGVGTGGCHSAAHLAAEWTEGPVVAAVDTDEQALEAAGLPERVCIGRNLTRGFGAGGDPAVGKLAAEEETARLRTLLGAADLVFVVTTLGGGTGSGAAPLVARLARDQGALVIACAALPFEFEGDQRQETAAEALRALRTHADAVISLPNQRLLELVPDRTSLQAAFAASDRMLAMAVLGLWKLFAHSGIINLNFSDLKYLVERSGGVCSFVFGEGQGHDRARQAVEALLKSPLLDHGNVIAQADAFLLNILGGAELALLDVQQVMAQLQAVARPDARIFMGATVDENWRDRIMLTVLAAENWMAGARAKPVEEPAPPPEHNAATPAPPAGAPGEKLPSGRTVQGQLNLDPTSRGWFGKVDPTLYHGEDLDLPTYVRRGVKLGGER
ncbi:MAG: cell division protein FtsZ [Kiritimatiellaeota bacterium]|nr:cell division protein FtsZ [Kiritimatiellota bacterium]